VAKNILIEINYCLEAFLLDEYKKHINNVEMKELIEPSGKFRRTKKTKELKRFLEEIFLIDFESKFIPVPTLKTEKQRRKFKNMILDSLESENLLILMNDLRLFEIDSNKERSGKGKDGGK